MKLSEMFDNLDELRIDNKDGWGAVPYNQNVDYRGLRVMVKPSMFLKLAHRLETPFSAGDIEKHLRSDGAIGAPFLMVAIPQDWFEGDMTLPAEIYGHEGRNRMTAALRVEGDDPVETHLFFGSGLRNRDIKPEIVERLNNNVISQEGGLVSGPWFTMHPSAKLAEEEAGQPANDRARLKKLFQDVEAAFLREDPYLVLEIMEEAKAKMTDSPALAKMFNSNMHQITRIILDEFGADSDPWMMEMNINNLRNIGVPVPNPRMTKEIQRSRGWVTKEVKEIYEDDSILKAMDLIMVLSMLGMDISIRDVVGDLDQNKDKIIKDLLRAMKKGHTHAAGSMIRALRASGRDWPEFKAFDKSISASTKLNEDDDDHDAEDIAKVVKAVAKAFNEGLPYDAIETLHYENLRVDDDPTIKALFDANMGRIAKWIAKELATIDIGDIHDVMMSLEAQIDDIGITIPNVTISDALQDAYTRIERNVIKQAMDSPTDAVIAIQALNNWGLGMELDDVIDVEDSKDEIIRSMLVAIKKNRPSKAFNMLSMLRDIDVDWPELDAIEKSLRSGTVVKEADEVSEKEQLRRVKSDWKAIKDIPNPSEKVQLISVRNDTRSLKFIKNPCDKARKIALMWDPKAITYLSNPTEADQLEAVKHFSRAIGHMKDPSEKVQLEAVRRSEIAIASIPNPSDKVQIAAVKKNGLAMFYIKNPSPALWKDEGAKKGVIVYMLSNIKEDPENIDGVLDNIKLLKKLGCPWSELDVMAKSMEAERKPSMWELDS